MSVPFKKVLVLDFETRWDSADYTLSKMTTEEYIRDPRFLAFGASYKWLGEGEPTWVREPDLHKFFMSVDWSTTAVMAHNAMFDVSILAWIYGYEPCFIIDTLSMARALRGTEVKNSLAVLAQEAGLPPKGEAIYGSNGLTVLPAKVEEELSAYCNHDVMLCEGVFNWLNALAGGVFPFKEMRVIDMVLKMYVFPQISLDKAMLKDAIDEEEGARTTLLTTLNVSERDLASNEKFAGILRAMGVEPPMKQSKTVKDRMGYAFAKNDAAFQALLNSENENIALLCEARLAVKSTQARTRAQRFYEVSTRGLLPVPLYYAAAHTHRIQAARGQGLNMQNLKRGSFLRRALLAPLDHEFVVGDLAQIEPRVLAWLADYEDLLDVFRAGKDAYAAFGAQMFGIPGLTKESHPDLRQSAKSALLGCGYGLGWWSFAAQLLVGFLGAPPVRYDKTFARQLGLTGQHFAYFVADEKQAAKALTIPRTCNDAEILVHALCAKTIIDRYRRTAEPVVALWRLCDQLIEHSLYDGNAFEYKCLRFGKERIELPNGLALRYPNLGFTVDEKGRKQWYYGEGDKRHKLYGSLLLENIVQALARIVMTDGMLRIVKRYPLVLTVHDEAVALAKKEEAPAATKWVVEQMTVEPAYMRGIPLAAEAGHAPRYGDAKK